MKQLFLDADGLLADFDGAFIANFGVHPEVYERTYGSAAFFALIAPPAKADWYGSLPVMPDARALFTAVQRYSPVILTGQPAGNWARPQKLRWRDAHFPGVPMIVCASKDKRNYGVPGDVLVDDRLKYAHYWTDMGGTFIHAPVGRPLRDVVAAVHAAMKCAS